MTFAIIVQWAALICGPNPEVQCMTKVSQCIYYEYLRNGGDADNAFEWCAENMD
jgi:hypothetical protein